MNDLLPDWKASLAAIVGILSTHPRPTDFLCFMSTF